METDKTDTENPFNLPDAQPDGFVVWQHDGQAKAVAHFADRDKAEEYARYCNRRDSLRWYEARRHWNLV